MSGYLCVDASVAAKWVLPEVHREESLGLYETCYRSATTIAVPPHFPVEVVNILRRRVVRGHLGYDEGRDLLAQFTQFAVRLVIPPRLYERAFELAQTYRLSAVYDAHYVALADLLSCDLWTDDQRLLNALDKRLPFVKWIGEYAPAQP
jgi:predicted nucleic acid-binding protein